MRLLLVKRVSTDRWLPHVEASDRPVEAVALAVATEFAVPVADVQAIVTDIVQEVVDRLRESVKVAIPAGAILWPADDPDADLVGDAAGVDRVTAARIRRLFGGSDGEAAWGRGWRTHLETALDPDAPAIDKIEAETFLATDRTRREQVEHLITQARVLKQTRGWR